MNELFPKIRRRLKRKFSTLGKLARKQAARAVYSLPGISASNPRHRVTTFKNYCRPVECFPAGGSDAPADWYLPVRPSETVWRTPPFSVCEEDALRFHKAALHYQHGDRFEIPEVFLACVKQAKIQGGDFLVLSPDNRIFPESLLSRSDLLEENGVLDTLMWPVPGRLCDTACLLAQNAPYAYYHWLVEVLPKLSLIEPFAELASIPLILPDALKPFQRESLEMAGVSTARMIGFDGGCWQVEKLIFPPLLSPTGCPSPHAMTWLRKRFLKNAVPSAKTSKKIYITRRDAPQRRILNEDRVIDLLRSQGFDVVCPGELSFAGQISLFRDAEVVVAAHGAGVTNMLFAPPNATLIELFGDNYINGCYWALANLCGQNYGFVTGAARGMDYSISTEKLNVMLGAISDGVLHSPMRLG